jgi:hypothetical protein
VLPNNPTPNIDGMTTIADIVIKKDSGKTNFNPLLLANKKSKTIKKIPKAIKPCIDRVQNITISSNDVIAP